MNKILVVGLGSIGLRHVRNISRYFPEDEIIIFSKRKSIPKKIKNNKNIIISNSINKCLENNPNIGFITNESAFHVPTSTKLARKGMDLFVEKPISNSTKGIEIL